MNAFESFYTNMQATTPAADKVPAPSVAKATPEVTSAEATKPTTRSSSGRKATKKRRSTFEIDPVTGTPKPSSENKKEDVKPEKKEVKFESKDITEHSKY